MTDTISTPVVVNGDPRQVQFEAGIRQTGILVGAVAGAIGASKVAAGASLAVQLAPAAASVLGFGLAGVSFVWGQIATRRHAHAAAVAALAAPDDVAVLK